LEEKCENGMGFFSKQHFFFQFFDPWPPRPLVLALLDNELPANVPELCGCKLDVFQDCGLETKSAQVLHTPKAAEKPQAHHAHQTET